MLFPNLFHGKEQLNCSILEKHFTIIQMNTSELRSVRCKYFGFKNRSCFI